MSESREDHEESESEFKEVLEDITSAIGTPMARAIWSQMKWSEAMLNKATELGVEKEFSDLLFLKAGLDAVMLKVEMDREAEARD